MFIPEYTITNNILRNIATIEYGKSIIENTTILPTWEKQLRKEAKIKFMQANLKLQGVRTAEKDIKKVLDKLKSPENKLTHEIVSLNKTLNLVGELAQTEEFEEEDIKSIYKEVRSQNQSMYRKRLSTGKPTPEEILAEMVELMDWYNSLDAKDTHPIIRAGILKAQMEQIGPFEQNNSSISNLSALVSLEKTDYNLGGNVYVENYYNKSGISYDKALFSISLQEGDLTEWLEYYTEGFAYEITQVKDKVQLLAKDTKVAKASGRAKLTPRQEKIVIFLQDYGVLQNRHFGKLFPKISEDSVLRDLKKLMSMGIVVKRGSTKASRYELK